MKTKEEDFVAHLFIASTHDYLMIFSDRGRAYWLKVHAIPDVEAAGKGKAIANLVSMEPNEKIAALLTVREWEEGRFVVMGTRKGVIKKTELTAFSNPRAGGIIAMGVEDDDSVIAVTTSDGTGQILIASRNGVAIRFDETDVRSMGRTAYGVRGLTLRDDDEVVAMEVLRPGTAVLTLTENGFGKRTAIDDYRVTARGGVGIINIQTTERNGRVVGVASVAESDEVMFITQQGKMLRTSAGAISMIGRNTQGVRLIDMEPEDKAVSLARLEEQVEPENGVADAITFPTSDGNPSSPTVDGEEPDPTDQQ
jgi:DNA gyrase subunit A